MKPITEDKIETFIIETLQSIGWEYIHGLAIDTVKVVTQLDTFATTSG